MVYVSLFYHKNQPIMYRYIYQPHESYGIIPQIVLRHRHVDAGTITSHATVQGRSLWMVGTHRTNHLKESRNEYLQQIEKRLPFVYFSVSIHYIYVIYEYNCMNISLSIYMYT